MIVWYTSWAGALRALRDHGFDRFAHAIWIGGVAGGEWLISGGASYRYLMDAALIPAEAYEEQAEAEPPPHRVQNDGTVEAWSENDGWRVCGRGYRSMRIDPPHGPDVWQ